MTTYKRNFKFNNNIMETISINIRKYRKDAGITQEQLATDIDISHEYLRRFESQKGIEGMSFENIYKISVVLGVTLDDLIEESESK